MAKQNNHWLYKKYDLEGWLLKHFNFDDEKEYIIFLIWALFVSVFLTNFI